MPRDARAYLSDIIDSCDAITAAVQGLNFAGYERNRLIRLCALSKPVDVVDLSTQSRFVELVEREGVPLYA
jgi:hypothetical protein